MGQHTQDGWITCYRKSDGTELRLPEHVVKANKNQLTRTKPTTATPQPHQGARAMTPLEVKSNGSTTAHAR